MSFSLLSAGVGRTGTFIALDALYRHGQRIQFVEILGYIKRMRECRMSMIQNVVSVHFTEVDLFFDTRVYFTIEINKIQ